jgi:hypothetical protein
LIPCSSCFFYANPFSAGLTLDNKVVITGDPHLQPDEKTGYSHWGGVLQYRTSAGYRRRIP